METGPVVEVSQAQCNYIQSPSPRMPAACMTAAGTMHQEWQTQATEWKAFAAGLVSRAQYYDAV